MRNHRNQYLASIYPFGSLTRMVLTLYLLCALTTVQAAGIPHDPSERSLEASFYQRKDDNSFNYVNNYVNNNNNVNVNNNANDKNNDKNKDENDMTWARPWDVSETTDTVPLPTPKPTKAPNTNKPTSPPTTKRPTW
jgi:lipopolysaccharide export LptBFGC system permease protein LptF